MKYEVLTESEKVFVRMMRDIRNARKEILLETYIYDDDVMGRKFLRELVKKAREGVKGRRRGGIRAGRWPAARRIRGLRRVPATALDRCARGT